MKIDIEEAKLNLECVKDMELNKWSIEYMDNAIKALEQQQAELDKFRKRALDLEEVVYNYVTGKTDDSIMIKLVKDAVF